VIQATVLDGLTTREAGHLLGVPQGTVKTRLMRDARTIDAAGTGCAPAALSAEGHPWPSCGTGATLMDWARIPRAHSNNAEPGSSAKGAQVEIWLWILGLVAVVGLIVLLVDRRRGSTGTSKADDRAGTVNRPPNTDQGPWAGGG
jgi:hypothetical protein